MASTINADNGVSSGSAGLKESADSSGVLALQTNGTTAVSIDTSQNTTLAGTLTTSSRGIAKASMPTGAVLQVVNATLTTTVATSSSSFVTTGLTASITPTSNTSKILIIVNGAGDTGAAGQQIVTTIFRSSTNLATGSNAFTNNYGLSSRIISNLGMSCLDSPATTSSTAYTAHFASQAGGTVTFNQSPSTGTSVATITLMEIAA